MLRILLQVLLSSPRINSGASKHLPLLPTAGPPQIRSPNREFVGNPFCPLPFFGDERIAKLLDLADELLADVALGVNECNSYG